MEGTTSTCTSLRTMWLALLVYHLGLILRSQAQNACLTNPTFREPVNSDVTVKCGTQRMELYILLCPVYFGGYNESLMALNAQYNKPECRGSPDWTVNPPVLKFNFSITEEAISACSNKLKITQEVGSGLFSDYSSVQFVNISGIINSMDPAAGTITYRQEMMYIFSCRYPLQYLVNNTEMSVSGVSLAVKDNNGSFISTLSMHLYEDNTYSAPLLVPDNGLKLKKRIFVEVRATNLTERFNVLLDRCYATTSPFPTNSSFYDLFVGCNHDGQTVMGVNGQQQMARFSFEAFRFVEHKNMTVSIFYLHCATRLCDKSVCSSIRPNCSANARKRREVESAQGTSVSDVATVSSGPIITKVDNGEDSLPCAAVTDPSQRNEPLLGAAITVAIVGTLCISAVVFVVYRFRSSKKQSKEKSTFHQ
ncbi:zona pellucida-like domain-containing protein 1 isoform X2 [Megalops cyprinoides]|uniref:zona pellucida-like domain-containing protein 1 isoform X2 n=1 Tax=Megalops cyprinoides TaxID=118141 RepID=UPI00186404DB|nr:zona pellucida-like domain-containing protein 1 isoform X2 [Megalops cyprinoides]